MSKLKSITVRLDDEQADKLQRLARESGMSASLVIRMLIEDATRIVIWPRREQGDEGRA